VRLAPFRANERGAAVISGAVFVCQLRVSDADDFGQSAMTE
jgi:hypothetical protein